MLRLRAAPDRGARYRAGRVGHHRSPYRLMTAPREVAIGKAEPGDRAAEALVAGLVQFEARVEESALHVRADAALLRIERAGRQMHEACRPAAAHAHHTRDGAVVENAAGSGG